MNTKRVVGAEKLDGLPVSDPRAIGSRRDLGRINAWMGHSKIVAKICAGASPVHILEIGAGDGRLMLSVARRLRPSSSNVEITLLDRLNVGYESVQADFKAVGWQCEPVTADVFEYLARSDLPKFDLIVANLFLHHFETEALSKLLGLAAERTNQLVACEPERSALGLAGSKMLWAIGCNEITRYDARVSVLAGFEDEEISELWPARVGWSLSERRVLPFSHVFVARRERCIATPR